MHRAVLCSALFALVACSSGAGGGTVPGRSEAPNVISPDEALSPTPAGTTNSLASETPLPADALADSIGVNTHVADYGSGADLQSLAGRIHQLGVRHIRDGILDSDPKYDQALSIILDAAPAKLDGITDCTGIALSKQSPTSPSQIRDFDFAIGNMLEAVEGPNEVDKREDGNWAADTRACLPGLRSAEPSLPFIAPSIADQTTGANALGNLSTEVDFGNGHRYFSGRNPGTAGWGARNECGIYGALTWELCEIGIVAGRKPAMITETGYSSTSEVDERTQEVYLSRLIFVNLRAGISRSYIYDLRDNSGSFGGNGLLRQDNSAKPAFNAIASEIAEFSDPGLTQMHSIQYSIQTAPSVEHLLFQKRDGTYLLAMWQEVPSWDIVQRTRITVSPQPAQITFDSAPRSPDVRQLNVAGQLVSQTYTLRNNSVATQISDRVTILSFSL